MEAYIQYAYSFRCSGFFSDHLWQFISLSVRQAALCGVAIGMPCVVIERAAATVLIGDYECRRRRIIPFVIIFVDWILIFAMTIGDVFGELA